MNIFRAFRSQIMRMEHISTSVANVGLMFVDADAVDGRECFQALESSPFRYFLALS